MSRTSSPNVDRHGESNLGDERATRDAIRARIEAILKTTSLTDDAERDAVASALLSLLT
jgi:hypothetical protein